MMTACSETLIPGTALVVTTYLNQALQCMRSPGIGEAFRGGPVLDGDSRQNRFRHTRAGEPVDGFEPGVVYANTLPGKWIYGGFVYPHFGHFIAEMVHRILFSTAIFPGVKLIFVSTPGLEYTLSLSQMPVFVQQILGYLGVDDSNCVILSQDTIVEVLHVVQQGCDLGGIPDPGYLAALRAYGLTQFGALFGSDVSVRSKRIYVSRSALPPGGRFLGDDYVEECLKRAGFEIFHPEHYSFRQQMVTYLEAETVLFAEGSACHGLELVGTQMLRQCLLLVRRPEVGLAFDRLLRSRAEKYASNFASKNLGTVVAHPNGATPLLNLAASVLDLPQLRLFLSNHVSGTLMEFDASKYLDAVKADFDSYLLYYRNLRQLLPETDVMQVQEVAIAVLAAMKRSGGSIFNG